MSDENPDQIEPETNPEGEVPLAEPEEAEQPQPDEGAEGGPGGEGAIEEPTDMTADQPPYEQMADEAEMPTEGAEGVVGVADEVEAELPSSVHDMAAYEAEAVQDHQDFQDPVGDSHVAKDGAGKASMGALSKVPPPGHSFTGAGAIPGVSIRQYLDTTVVPVLRLGLRELVKSRPADPFDFLADYIRNNKPK